jgi:hypothetical protein
MQPLPLDDTTPGFCSDDSFDLSDNDDKEQALSETEQVTDGLCDVSRAVLPTDDSKSVAVPRLEAGQSLEEFSRSTAPLLMEALGHRADVKAPETFVTDLLKLFRTVELGAIKNGTKSSNDKNEKVTPTA